MREFGWTPSEWVTLSRREKGMVIAGIDIQVDQENRAQKEATRKAERARHH